jgi:hypothetical protein
MAACASSCWGGVGYARTRPMHGWRASSSRDGEWELVRRVHATLYDSVTAMRALALSGLFVAVLSCNCRPKDKPRDLVTDVPDDKQRVRDRAVRSSPPEIPEGRQILVADSRDLTSSACAGVLDSYGVFLSETGVRAGSRLVSPTDGSIAAFVAALDNGCGASASAQVLRALLAVGIGDNATALRSAQTAARLNNDLTDQTRQTAHRIILSLQPLVEKRLATPIEEGAQRELAANDTMWIPGLGDPTSMPTLDIGLNVPTLNTNKGLWIGLGVGGSLLALGAGFFTTCWVDHCFDLGLATDGTVTSHPIDTKVTSPSPPWGRTLRVLTPKDPGLLVLKVKLFADLDLPPVGGLLVSEVTAQSFERCADYFTFIGQRALLDSTWDEQGAARAGITSSNITFESQPERFDWNGQQCWRHKLFTKWSIATFSQYTPLALTRPNARSISCQTVTAEFNEAVRRHEAQHQRDFANVLKQPPSIPSSTDYYVCRRDGEADSDLKARYVNVINIVVKKWKEMLESQAVMRMHETLPTLKIDCSACDSGIGSPPGPSGTGSYGGLGVLKISN